MKIIYFVVILFRTHFAIILPFLLSFIQILNSHPTNVRTDHITNLIDGSKFGLHIEDPTTYSSSDALCIKRGEKGINLNKFGP